MEVIKLLVIYWLSSKNLNRIEREARVLLRFLGLVFSRIALRKLVAVFLVMAVTARPVKLFCSSHFSKVRIRYWWFLKELSFMVALALSKAWEKASCMEMILFSEYLSL